MLLLDRLSTSFFNDTTPTLGNLHNAQFSLASHARALSGALAEHDAIQREVSLLIEKTTY